MWIIAVIVIGSLVVLGILLLSMPFDLAVELEVYGKPELTVNWAWSFGLIKKRMKIRRTPSTKKKPRQKQGLIKTIRRIQSASGIVRTKGFLGQVIKLAQRIFHRIKIKRLETEWFIGLDDPEATFYLFTLTEPVNRLVNYSLPYSINIRPSFIEPGLQGYLRTDLRLYPIRMVPPFLQFVFSRPTLRVIRHVVGSRWRRNR